MANSGERFDNSVLDWLELATKWWALGLLLALLVVLMWDFRKCYLLLRGMREGKQNGGRIEVIYTILRIAIQDFTLVQFRQRQLIRRVRMRVEHELFPPTPQVDIGRFQSINRRNKMKIDHDVAGANRAGAYLLKLSEWKTGLVRIYQSDNQVIHVETAADVNAHFADIERYFDLLAGLGITDSAAHFLCTIEIHQGFVAPMHLLSGLLVEFNQKWSNILTAFNRDANDPTPPSLGAHGSDIRQIQMFIYTCWLLWGPSIPLCQCEWFDARFRTIQYGFGDENNSLEIVGTSELIDPAMSKLLEAARQHMKSTRAPDSPTAFAMPMALPANVRGRLRLSDTIGKDSRDTNALPKNALKSWQGGQDRRPVLFLSKLKTGDVTMGAPEYQSADLGRLDLAREDVRSKYYSAYLWIAFVMMQEQSDGSLLPLSQVHGGKSRPWMDLIPFFEHGNLADPESCIYSKRQLAAKVVDAFLQLSRTWPDGGTDARFVFACSIDESGCGTDMAFDGWQGGKSIRDLVNEQINAEVKERKNPEFIAMMESGTLILEPTGHAWSAAHKYTACRLPSHIAEHYKSMDYES